MKSFILFTLLGVVLFVASTEADCTTASDSDDGEVAAWFKNLGCKIKEGANDVKDAAKPIADKIGTTAKEFGNTVAQKYDELKHKLTEDEATVTPETAIRIEPTEKIPLAPLGGDAPIGVGQVSAPAATGEQNPNEEDVTPVSIDNRFLLQSRECPRGQAMDHHNQCRPSN